LLRSQREIYILYKLEGLFVIEERMIASFDGTKLFFRKEIPTNPKAVLVLIHGMCEHQGRYGYLTARLNARGYAVYKFDHRGHGKSDGMRVYYSDFQEIIKDTDVVAGMAFDENPQLPVLMLGHSMGGYAAALYGIQHPGRVKGIVLSGPITVNNSGLGVAVCEQKPSVDSYWPASSYGVSSDPAMVKQWEDDPLVDKQISAGLLYTLLDGCEYIRKNTDKFTDPALFLHGGRDPIVTEKDSRDMFGAISSEDKELIVYAKLFHEIFNEPSKDEVIDDLICWLDKHLE